MSDSRLDYEIQETNLAPFFFQSYKCLGKYNRPGVCVRAEREMVYINGTSKGERDGGV
jgi:hypothetical protein